MQKLLLTLCLTILVCLSNYAQEKNEKSISPDCQTSQGHYFISPNTGFSGSQGIGSGGSDLNLGLNLDQGYFIVKNFAIMCTFGYNYSKSSSEVTGSESYITSKKYVNGKLVYTYGTRSTSGTTSIETSSFAWGGGFRYYIGGKIFLGAGYLSEKAKDSDAVDNFNLQVGYAAYLTKNLAIEPSVSYLKGIGNNNMNQIMGKIGLGIYF